MTMTLTKAELTNQLAEKLGLEKIEAITIVEAFFQEIAEALGRGGEVKLANFGIFAVQQKAERQGRNPKTGEEKVIKARRVVAFNPSPKLRSVVLRRSSPSKTHKSE